MLYRILRPLARDGQTRLLPEDGPSALEWLSPEQHQQLIDCGAIAPIHAPPLSELPGWESRADRLQAAGISSVVDLLAATDIDAISEMAGVRPATIRRWQREAAAWLMPPRPASPCKK